MANPANSMRKTAFILAAGAGSRMLPLTENTPKPLLKINNKPMIDYTLDLLKLHQFREIGVNLFYLGDKIRKHLNNENLHLVQEKTASGTAGGVLAISKKLKPDSPFLVISSDMMINFDLSRIYKFHLKHKGIATICCYFRPKSKLNAKKSGLVVFNKKTKQILKFTERPINHSGMISSWVNSSVYIFSPEIIDLIPKKPISDIAKDLVPKLLRLKKPIFAYPVNRKEYYQLGVDTPDRIEQVEEDLKSGKLIF